MPTAPRHLGRSFCVLTTLLATTAPGFGMIVAGGQQANQAAKKFGAGTGGAICLVDALGAGNQFEVGTGTLIRIDPDTQQGLVLTSGHLLTKVGGAPVAIGLSFAANPVRDLQRIFATGYRLHPGYDPATRQGPDLALITFPLPKGFAAKPMLLPAGNARAEFAAPSLFLFGGYGSFHLNQEADPSAERKEDGRAAAAAAPAWDWTRDDGRVRRIGYCLARYQPQDQATLSRDSLEAVNRLSSKAEVAQAQKGRPFNFVPTDHPIFNALPEFHEVIAGPADSGGPLFSYDADANAFRIQGVFATSLFGQDRATGDSVVISNAIAVTPEAVGWIEGGQVWQELRVTAKDRLMIRATYNQAFGLKLELKDLLAE